MLSILGWSLIALIYVFLYFGIRATWRQFTAGRRAPARASAAAPHLKPAYS